MIAMPERGTPQHTAVMAWALLHIEELRRRGWIDGGDGFEVQADQCWGALRGLIVVDNIPEPDRELTEATALGLMVKTRGVPEEDRDMVLNLLSLVELDWPSS
jgi:hypothetical protein